VPAFNVGSAVFSGDGSFDFVKDPKASSERLVAFKKDYHQVTDEYHPSWDLSGMVQQAQFTLNLGYEVANDKNCLPGTRARRSARSNVKTVHIKNTGLGRCFYWSPAV
jgi:hypothetical protein